MKWGTSQISCERPAITSPLSITCNLSVENASASSLHQPSLLTKPGSTFRQENFGVIDKRLRTLTSGCLTPTQARIAPHLSHKFTGSTRQKSEDSTVCGSARLRKEASQHCFFFFSYWRSRSFSNRLSEVTNRVGELVNTTCPTVRQLDGCGAGRHLPCSNQPYCDFAERAGKSKGVKKSLVLRSPQATLQWRFSHMIEDEQNIHMYKELTFKGSVERSLLPWAIFLIFTRNRPWKSEDHLCTPFFIEMSKERLEKSERTPPVSWRPWALAYSRDRPYNFSCLSAVSKNRRFRSFFLGFGVSFGEEKPFVTSNAIF